MQIDYDEIKILLELRRILDKRDVKGDMQNIISGIDRRLAERAKELFNIHGGTVWNQ